MQSAQLNMKQGSEATADDATESVDGCSALCLSANKSGRPSPEMMASVMPPSCSTSAMTRSAAASIWDVRAST